MTEMTDSQVLAAAGDLIRDKKNWTTGKWCHRDVDGVDSFCIEGAIGHVLGMYEVGAHSGQWTASVAAYNSEYPRREHLGQLFAKTAREMFPDGLPAATAAYWNDQILTHAEVMDVLDKTVIQLEERGQ